MELMVFMKIIYSVKAQRATSVKIVELTVSNLCCQACLRQCKQLSEIAASLPPKFSSSQEQNLCTSLSLPLFQQSFDQLHCREFVKEKTSRDDKFSAYSY